MVGENARTFGQAVVELDARYTIPTPARGSTKHSTSTRHYRRIGSQLRNVKANERIHRNHQDASYTSNRGPIRENTKTGATHNETHVSFPGSWICSEPKWLRRARPSKFDSYAPKRTKPPERIRPPSRSTMSSADYSALHETIILSILQGECWARMNTELGRTTNRHDQPMSAR